MTALTFDHISQTGRTQAQILEVARSVQASAEERFGKDPRITLQHYVDGAIDAAIEHAQ